MTSGLVHLRVVESASFSFYEVYCPPSFRIPAKRSDDSYACLLMGGSVEERVFGLRRKWKAGTLHFHEKGDAQSALIGPDGVRCLSIAVKPVAEKALAPALRQHRQIRPESAGPLEVLALQLADLVRPSSVRKARLEAEAFRLFRALGSLPRISRSSPAWIDEVRQMIETHLASPPSLAQIAARVGLQGTYVCSAFRQFSGESIRAYTERLRVGQARELILATKLSVGEIAAELGFCDQSHLDRAFRKRTGMSPSEFRRRSA